MVYLSSPAQVHLLMSVCSGFMAAGLTGLLFYSVFIEDLNNRVGDDD
jgi:hypothetical protein